MTKTIECVLLIDDDVATNFYNKRVIDKHEKFKEIVIANSARKALFYLLESSLGKCKKPSIIFLDINMPGMNGWEFLQEYKELDETITHDIKLIMLTTSNSIDDYNKSLTYDLVNDFINKPLSGDLLDNLIETHYNVINNRKII